MAKYVTKLTYIGQLEMLAAVMTYWSVPELRGRRVIHWIDNMGAVAALVKSLLLRRMIPRRCMCCGVRLLRLSGGGCGQGWMCVSSLCATRVAAMVKTCARGLVRHRPRTRLRGGASGRMLGTNVGRVCAGLVSRLLPWAVLWIASGWVPLGVGGSLARREL